MRGTLAWVASGFKLWQPSGVKEALDLLRKCGTPHGFLAAGNDVRNYARVWSRDGCICGLAALCAGDEGLLDTFAATLRTLAEHQGRSGQIPSNVDPRGGHVSYGGKAGRVDATTWFVVGASLLGRRRPRLGEELQQSVERALAVLEAWELNQRGLLYVPRAGNWADELPLGGYTLYDQVLRLWAFECSGHHDEASALRGLIEASYWPSIGAQLYDPGVLTPMIRADRQHHLAAFEPGGACERFDAFGLALCVLLGLEHAETVLDDAAARRRHGLVPALDPPYVSDDPEWAAMERLASHAFRNPPGSYQNGGLWPMINGFWSAAARRCGRPVLADELRDAICAANRLGDGRYSEYLHAEPGSVGGTALQAWSAAGEVLATTGIGRWMTSSPLTAPGPADPSAAGFAQPLVSG